MFPNQNNLAAAGAANDAQQQNLNYNGLQQQQQQQQPQQQQQQQQQTQQLTQSAKNVRKKPYVKITEQPAGKALRFRYECEGRSAGSIPGVNSTPENKTYPTIEIVGYKGRAVVVVSCVTKDTPYRPHPHNLVGKEGCKKGVCTLEISSETMRAVFSNLGIQCVKKKDIEAALKAREEIRVDPFKTGFSHRFQPSSIDLNSVRLCFQVFMESEQKGRFTSPLPPVVSEPIFDKKAMSDLVICRLCSCSATVLGNTQIILLCEKVAKEDITVRFFEEKNGQTVWEALGDFQHTDVHKQTAITFKTPRYHTLDITEPAKVFIQLRRPSDGVTSEALPFEYVPLDSGRHTFWNLHRHLKRKPDEDIFQQILRLDGSAAKREMPTIEVIDLNTPTLEQPEPTLLELVSDQVPQDMEQVAAEAAAAAEAEAEAQRLRTEQEIDTIIDEKVRELEQQELEQQLVMPEPEPEPELVPEPHVLSANDKINEWMKSNELEQQPHEPSPPPGNASDATDSTVETQVAANEEDKTLNKLLEQVAELDEIYTDFVMQRDTYNNTLQNELQTTERPAMQVDDSFDDAATYTSLQIAFKNPVIIPMDDVMPPTPPMSQCAPEDAQHYDAVEVNSQQLSISSQQTLEPSLDDQLDMEAALLLVCDEEKLPPLPPKRLRKQDSNAENRSIDANTSDTNEPAPPVREKPRLPPPIIHPRMAELSRAPTKRLPQPPSKEKEKDKGKPKPTTNPNFNTLPRQKKPGFFSKLFSRRKSKPELMHQSNENCARLDSKLSSSNAARSEPSLAQFNARDPLRASQRSAKSFNQSKSANASPLKSSSGAAAAAASRRANKQGKPVGRSVSSVSCKRPAYLNADVVHIPLKGDSASSLQAPHEGYSNSSTITVGGQLDRRTASALQLAEIPISDGGMELVAIADRQSLHNLVSSIEAHFNVQMDPNLDLTEVEHFALYTSVPPQATASEFDETSAYYAPVDAGEILTPDQVAKRLAAANSSSCN
ncbi:embryonic polarity protein dorsal isoform X1 [Drosophila busckii]|uniref:embryonic polarity protein dorsal isoform X1 n=1 Tax=Drosophila busckii TaxID=30019 RepID=UPI001433120D|nr:embryonic polarity protein dorsal isoform X1 [Drosophila busckii]XP_017854501.2 embryonic polarity protein dorsal isoform X1 [Drosophila busckii]XP_017854502.2 embryonic polarity protein dorsal isoform X1 [Drosophila busckii]XP_017854503.2 embryonic polarity protein dorsal isoform X1 [Drosophila busckii]